MIYYPFSIFDNLLLTIKNIKIMANINLLHELLMFAKASNRKMTIKETVEEYYSHYLEDCYHTPIVKLIPQEYTLRKLLDSSVLKENQKALIWELLEEIGIAEAEVAAEKVIDEGINAYYPPEYYDDECYEDCCDEGILEPMQSVWKDYIKSRENDYLLHERFPNDYDLPF